MQLALEQGNAGDFEFHAHRMQMTLELLQTHALWAELQKGREFLAEGSQDDAAVQRLLQDIQQELDALAAALKDEVRMVAASLSIVEGL
jgi:Skp family chaperone for outer membrane proteins